LDDVLTVGVLAGGEEPHSHPGSLPEGAGRGRKNGAAAEFAKALQHHEDLCKNVSISPGPTLKKAKNKHTITCNCFFLFRSSGNHVNTLH
jgi:hypothetical protein